MKNILRRTSVLVACLSGIGLQTGVANAQEAKIVKVQGSKAIVQFGDDYKPRVGETLNVGESGASGGKAPAGFGSRAKVIGGSAELSSLSRDPGGASTTTIALTGRYGWNTGTIEYGPLGTVVYQSSGGDSATSFGAGAFSDYNFVPNRPGTALVYGLGSEASYAISSSKLGNSSSDTTTLAAQFGGQLKWFGLGSSVAVRADAVYSYEKASSSGPSLTTSGLVFKGGLYVYF